MATRTPDPRILCHPERTKRVKGFCRSCYAAQKSREYRERVYANPERLEEYRARYRVYSRRAVAKRTPKQQANATTLHRRWRAAHRNRWAAYGLAYRHRIRSEVYAHYGNRCACCGEREPVFLTIDHIHGGGNKHRREVGRGGYRMHRWIRDHGYPDGFRLLCWNCNAALGLFKHCPHQRIGRS